VAPFIDLLTSQLFVLGFSGLIMAYLAFCALNGKGKDNDAKIRSGSAVLAVLGFYTVVTGLYGQFTWPLPGSYNILFYDMYTLWGLFIVGLAWSLHSRAKLRPLGLFATLLGFMSLCYGITGYDLGLTQSPIALLGLYSLFGISGVLGYPITVLLESDGKNRQAIWKALGVAFVVALILGSLLAILIGTSAVPAHLASPP